MVRIRLRRMGAKKKPFYRIVVADQRSPRDGRFIEAIGTYDPLKQPAEIVLDTDRAAEWVRNGASPSDAVAHILRQQNVIDENGKVITASEEAAELAVEETEEVAA